MRPFVAAVALCASVFAATPAFSQLAIDRLWVDFDAGSPNRADVVIRNESNDRYYITVTPSEILGPGTADEKRVEIVDPDKLGLLVTPNRVIIDPGSMRSIRIVSLNSTLSVDRVYRIKIAPQIGEIQTDDPGAGNRGVSIKLLAAYDLLVTARPKSAKPELVATRGLNEISIRNTGNSNILLFDGEACPVDTKSDTDALSCEKIGAKRMYVGTEWKIPLKIAGERVKFKQRVSAGSDAREVTF